MTEFDFWRQANSGGRTLDGYKADPGRPDAARPCLTTAVTGAALDANMRFLDGIHPDDMWEMGRQLINDTLVKADIWKKYIETPVVSGIGISRLNPDRSELQAQHDSIITQAREEGAKAERLRITAKLAALQPMDQPYTRRDWALEQRGEKAMYEKIMKALFGPDKKGE